MFDKQKLLILPIAALALTLSGGAFAYAKSPPSGNAVYGSTSPFVQDRYTNYAPMGVIKNTPTHKLAEAAVYGSTSPFVQDKYTNEAPAGVTKETANQKLAYAATGGSTNPFVQDRYTAQG